MRRLIICLLAAGLLAPGAPAAAQTRPENYLLAEAIAAEVTPATDGATAVWATSAGDGRYDLHAALDLRQTPVGGGAIRRIAAGVPVAALAVDGEYALWSSREETATQPRQQLAALHIPSGRIELLADLTTLSAIHFDVAAGRAVWNEEQRIKSILLGSGEKAALVEDIGENAQYTRPSVGGINLERNRIVWEENTGGQVPTFALRSKLINDPGSVLLGSGTGDTAFDFSGETVAWWASTARGEAKLSVSIFRIGIRQTLSSVNAGAVGGAKPLVAGPYVMRQERICEPPAGLGCAPVDDAAWATHGFLGFTFKLPFMPVDASQETIIWTAQRQGATSLFAGPLRVALPTQRKGPPSTSSDHLYFPARGYELAPPFSAFWIINGRTPVFGEPLTQSFQEVNPDLKAPLQTQYTERQRFEAHPENQGTAYEVLLGRLGADLLASRGRDWRAEGPELGGAEQLPGACVDFAATGRTVCGPFLDYWRGHGLDLGQPGLSYDESLALFGLPLTAPRPETNPDGDRVLTQWFERARFEWHPGNPEPYKVLLGRLGAEALAERGW